MVAEHIFAAVDADRGWRPHRVRARPAPDQHDWRSECARERGVELSRKLIGPNTRAARI
jgi:hypothetical protein